MNLTLNWENLSIWKKLKCNSIAKHSDDRPLNSTFLPFGYKGDGKKAFVAVALGIKMLNNSLANS